MASRSSYTPVTAIAVSILALILLVAVMFRPQLSTCGASLAFTGRLPSCPPSADSPHRFSLPPITAVFRERPIFENLSASADSTWRHALLTRKGGVLWVERNATMDQGWGIGMFHALHCLEMLRVVVRESVLMREPPHPGASMEKKKDEAEKVGVEPPAMDPVHVGHCVGYIAQHLLCAADGTIEPPWLRHNEEGDVVDGGVDGEGFRHHCRDASLLWETAATSENEAVKLWDWQMGDTIESVFGK